MEPAPIKPPITIDDLDKIDIRIGRILKVEDVPASDKLVRLTEDFGDHTRIILVGMKKERPDPTEIEGKANTVCRESRTPESGRRDI